MKIKICIWAILSIALVGCGGDRSAVFYDRACQKAAEKLAESLTNDPDVPKSQRIAVVKIDNDEIDRNEKDWLRENLLIALNKQNVNLIGMMEEHSEMDEVLEAHDIQIKYNDFYDHKFLVRLGKLIPPRAILVLKIQPIVKDKNKSELIFYGKLLDLELGKMTWADKYHSISESQKRNVVIFVAIVVLSAIACFLLMLITGLSAPLIVITVIIDLIAFYLLLFDYVKSLL